LAAIQDKQAYKQRSVQHVKAQENARALASMDSIWEQGQKGQWVKSGRKGESLVTFNFIFGGWGFFTVSSSFIIRFFIFSFF